MNYLQPRSDNGISSVGNPAIENNEERADYAGYLIGDVSRMIIRDTSPIK